MIKINTKTLSPSLFSASLPLGRALNLAILAALCPAFAYANPNGAQVVNGQVSIDTATPGVTTVTNSPNAIINWQNFSIGQNELTQFIQQNGQSAVLNRIIGQNPSEILGQLTSNGKVFLINPNGIVFGAGSVIDTQGLIASSLNLSDQDFLSGNYHFMAGSSAGNILNEGIIRAGKDGNIILIAPHIENNGIIKSEGGSITLAAGQELTITNLDSPDIRFQIQAPADSVLNLGKLLTEGGAINVFASTIKHSGEINADSVQIDKQGHIQLVAQQDITLAAGSKISVNNSLGDAGTIHIDSKTGTTLAQGTIEARSTTLTAGPSGKGGNIELLGERVGLLDQARINASGENGGGQVLIGGDYQGKNPGVHNAKATYVGKDTSIKADAKTNGDGGKVIVWSDETTRVYGNISAKGGTNSGNGGFVETSGHNYLDFQGLVDTRAPHGTDGTLLLDPSDIAIENTTDNFGGGSFSGGIFSGATVNSILTWATINAQSGSLSIQTSTATSGSGDININASGTLTGPSTLTLLANRNINFANGVSVSSSGSRDFNLIAGWNNTGWAVTSGTGNITFGTNSSLSTTGNVWFNAGNSVTGGTTSAITANTLNIGNTNGGSLPGGVSLQGNNMVNTLAAQIDSSTGSLTFNNGKSLTIGAGTYFNGIVATGNTNPINITTTAGNISANQNITSSGSVSLTSSAGTISEAGGVINTTGLLTTSSSLGTTLNGANTVGSFHASNSTSGNIALTNTATNLSLTGVSNSAANSNVTINNTGKITNSGATSASNVSLKADKMALASGTISGSNSASLLSNNAIDISTGATDNLSNTLELSNAELNTITTPILRIGDANSGAIDIKSALSLTKISSGLNLTSGGNITQQVGATIAALPGLSLSGTSVKLTEANGAGVISGKATAGNFQYYSPNQLTVATVDGVSGITVPSANDIWLSSNVDINQQTGANLTGGGLGLKTLGSVLLFNSGNNISNIAADLSVGGLLGTGTGSFGFFSNSSLSVSSILSPDGVKIDGITTNNRPIDLVSSALSINSLINAGTGNVGLTASTAGAMIGTTVDSGINGGAVSLKSDKMSLIGSINVGSSGMVSLTPNAVEAIHLGTVSDTIGNTLELSNAELNTITAGTLRIGNNASGVIDIKSPLALTHISSALNLTSGGNITQQVGATITALPGLSLSGTSVKLTEANGAGVISGKATAGNFRYHSSNQLTVATVDGVSGITVPSANDIWLSSNVGINQQTGANLTGGGLGLKTTGSVWLPNFGNNISNIAADLSLGGLGTGSFGFFSNSNLSVSSILSTDGTTIKINGITTNNKNIDIDSKALTINSLINAGTGNVGLTASTAGAMIGTTVGSGINGGAVSLKSDKMSLIGSINVGSSGMVSLTPNAVEAIHLGTVSDTTGNTLELSNAELNTITAGTLRIGNNASGVIDIKSPLALTHISSALNLTSGGNITQQVDATIVVPALSLSGASVTLTEANPVGVISGSTSAGDFRYHSSNQLTVATVDGVSGITVPSAYDIRLKSNVGINQQQGADLVGGGLGLKTTGSVWLPNFGNNISNIAADLSLGGLGTGSFGFFSNSNLSVSNILSTDGTTIKINGITTNNKNIDIGSKALTINSLINAGTAGVDLTTDTLTWDTAGNGRVIAGEASINQYTAWRPITIGAGCIGGSETCLSITELWRIQTPVIGIGYDSSNTLTSGDIYVAGITYGSSTLSDRNAATTRIGLLSGGSIAQSAPPIDVYDLGIEANGPVTLDAVNNITNLAALTLGSNFTFNNGAGFNVIQMAGGTVANDNIYNINGINTCSASGSCGNVLLTTTSGDLTIPAQINAGTGNVSLMATNGSIYGSGTSPDIIASVLDINAFNNIFGTSGLHTQISRINSLNATNGLIDILNFGGVILGPSGTNSVTASINAAGNIKVTAQSPITVNGGVVSTTGSINLTASDTGVLTINAPITVSNTSDITLAGGTLAGSYAGLYEQYFNNGTFGGTSDSTLSETVTTSTQTTTSGVLGTTTQLGNPLTDNSSSNNSSTGGTTNPTTEDKKTNKQCTK